MGIFQPGEVVAPGGLVLGNKTSETSLEFLVFCFFFLGFMLALTIRLCPEDILTWNRGAGKNPSMTEKQTVVVCQKQYH